MRSLPICSGGRGVFDKRTDPVRDQVAEHEVCVGAADAGAVQDALAEGVEPVGVAPSPPRPILDSMRDETMS